MKVTRFFPGPGAVFSPTVGLSECEIRGATRALSATLSGSGMCGSRRRGARSTTQRETPREEIRRS